MKAAKVRLMYRLKRDSHYHEVLGTWERIVLTVQRQRRNWDYFNIAGTFYPK